ncbi:MULTISPECIES: ABC transporter permease [unclassified Ruminococcus]|uniref:ABC transporter permease n=1 Tax=unclassified Ruminococcus TaxID=2608920 RepID=UPI00210D308C|nr:MULTISPECIES: ABC transporter permease [unclassified Ruminococcus]MCQ4023377.1 FtsX-like permease family protein [Ruminococcus sp. zg-924]MCQ4115744.1 FtsX-like permease family protein [Ruminococcus sp. zg-921]
MKILNKLTLKNLRLNKSRTIVTIIGIILSAALITVVAGIASSGQQSVINAEIYARGDYDLCLRGNVTKDNIESVQANRNVNSIFYTDSIGCAKMPSPKLEHKPYVYIMSISSNAFGQNIKTSLAEGRYPQNSNELVVPSDYIKWSNESPKIGDTITLDIGNRVSENGEIINPIQSYGFIDNSEEREKEDIDVKLQRQYKIVGILSDESTNAIMLDQNSACISVFTAADINNLSDNAVMYVDLTPDGEKNCFAAASEISGVDEEEMNLYFTGDGECPSAKYESIDIHTTLLAYKGYGMSDETMNSLYMIASIVIAIVIITSVFVIRNSFAISITEKTKLYGMIASVGATSKQIRKNVMFEGFILGLIGIPLGLLLGVGVVALLLQILNILLKDGLNGITLVYSVPPLALTLSVVLSAATIFFSTISSAVRASKIAPIDAIRSSNDITLGKKKRSLHSPKFVKKLFGIGGDVAYKNLKRSKKKYRTTVISIVVSVALFISISSFINYGNKEVEEHYQTIDYNLFVDSSGDVVFEDYENDLKKIANMDGVTSSRMDMLAHLEATTSNLSLSKEAEEYTDLYYNGYFSCDIFGLTDDEFKAYTKSLGLSYDEVKDKGILYNTVEYRDKDGKTQYADYLNIEKGAKLDFVTTIEKSDPDYKEIGSIEIAADSDKTAIETDYDISPGTLYVRQDWMRNNIPSEELYLSLQIHAENADELEQNILSMGYANIYVYNYDKIARSLNSIYLAISIFIYGFIIVITLIGVTNIFNTITTNMRLRSKEFAMLKSIGMTKREFNRMVRLESLFYGLKSLIIGIPIGVLGGYLIYYAFNSNGKYAFDLPWLAILISVVFVFAIVWLIMRFSIIKVQKQNIIETIRNDNI